MVLKLRLAALLLVGLCVAVHAQPSTPHTFAVANGQFPLDGKPFQIISGEMHYPRIPRAYWRDRFRMAKAMGLNTITTYVFWNVHEPQPGRLRLHRQERCRRVHPRGPAGRPLRHPAPRPLRLRRVGVRRLSRPGCSRTTASSCAPPTRSSSTPPNAGSRASARNLRRSRSATAAPSSCRPGRERVRLLRRRPRLHGADSRRLLVDAGFTKSQLYTADGPEQVPERLAARAAGRHQLWRQQPGDAQKALRDAQEVSPRRPLHERASTGPAGSITGASKHAHTNAADAGREPRVDARAGLLRQHLHVPRRHQLRLDERRQQQRQATTSPTSPATTTTPPSTRAAGPRRSTSPSATSSPRPPA